MTVSIRALRPDDIDVVVEFSLRAWQPVFESFRQVMGAEIYRRVYPDWKTIQAEVVESSCRAEGNRVWVAEADGRPVGYTVVVVHPVNRETQSGEIDMLAVDPDYQQRGIGIALVCIFSVILWGQRFDAAALGGIALIVAGVLLITLKSEVTFQ